MSPFSARVVVPGPGDQPGVPHDPAVRDRHERARRQCGLVAQPLLEGDRGRSGREDHVLVSLGRHLVGVRQERRPGGDGGELDARVRWGRGFVGTDGPDLLDLLVDLAEAPGQGERQCRVVDRLGAHRPEAAAPGMIGQGPEQGRADAAAAVRLQHPGRDEGATDLRTIENTGADGDPGRLGEEEQPGGARLGAQLRHRGRGFVRHDQAPDPAEGLQVVIRLGRPDRHALRQH